MIFDINMKDLRLKAREVTEGHTTVAPTTSTYESVVSQDSSHIYLKLAALNDMEVNTSDTQNAYLIDTCSEKIWTKLGSEFGPDLVGKKSLVIRALYGFKPAGASFRNHL